MKADKRSSTATLDWTEVDVNADKFSAATHGRSSNSSSRLLTDEQFIHMLATLLSVECRELRNILFYLAKT